MSGAPIDRALDAGERVRRFLIVGETWLPGGDELTPTMKLRRKPIAAKHTAAIDALYGPPADGVIDLRRNDAVL